MFLSQKQDFSDNHLAQNPVIRYRQRTFGWRQELVRSDVMKDMTISLDELSNMDDERGKIQLEFDAVVKSRISWTLHQQSSTN